MQPAQLPESRQPGSQAEKPWQLKMFSVAVKKRRKLDALLSHLGPALTGDCLLVTCGDNNGALNWHIRRAGGNWSFAELEPQNIPGTRFWLKHFRPVCYSMMRVLLAGEKGRTTHEV